MHVIPKERSDQWKTEKNNALAELAAELKRSLNLQMPGTSYYRDRTIFCTPEVIDKSMRIVAKLAKAYEPCFPAKSADDVIDECRAIAEGLD